MFGTRTFAQIPRIVFLTFSVSILVSLGAGTSGAQPPAWLPSLGDIVNPIVPAPSPPPMIGPIPPIVQAPPNSAGGKSISDELYAQLLPSPVGDAFFDEWPANLSSLHNGDIIGAPDDVTAVSQAFFPAPGGVHVRQVKFKTTDSDGADSFGTATLAVPNNAWTGNGTRPLLVDEKPIDALGRACTPGYTLRKGVSFATNQTDFLPPASQTAVLQNYAVLIPDHEGPRMSYAEPVVAGRITLDAIRAVQQLDSTFVDSPMVINGYSGGAIATRGTALEVSTYAPELARNIRLAVMGGNPIDYEVLGSSMDGPVNLASGVFHGATVGYLRSHREGFLEANNIALQIATSPYKDFCIVGEGLMGALVPTSALSNDGDPMNSSFATTVFAHLAEQLRRPSAVPLYVFNGAQEFWIPAEPARRFARNQCDQGVTVSYSEPFGEHLVGAITGLPDQFAAINRALQGVAPQSNCGTF